MYKTAAVISIVVASECPSDLPDCVGHCPSISELEVGVLKAETEAIKDAIRKTIDERRCESRYGLEFQLK